MALVIGLLLMLVKITNVLSKCAFDEVNREFMKQHPWALNHSNHIRDEVSKHVIKMKQFKEKHPHLYKNVQRRRLIDTHEPAIGIDVMFHVFYAVDEPEVRLSLAQLDSAIDILNEDFNADNEWVENGLVRSEFEDIIGSVKLEFRRWHHEYYEMDPGWVAPFLNFAQVISTEHEFKQDEFGVSRQQFPESTLNIFIAQNHATTPREIYGYTFIPEFVGQCSVAIETWRDGVYLRPDFVGRRRDSPPSGTVDEFFLNDDEVDGHLVSHEVGHYLGLLHPWDESRTCSDDGMPNAIGEVKGDGISDTPPVNSEGVFTECEDGSAWTKDSCDGTSKVMIENLMDYYGDCSQIFTEEQAAHMRSYLATCRNDLYIYDQILTEISPWLFVIDISPSMENDIAAIRDTAKDLIEILNENFFTPKFFVLAQYHNSDPPESKATLLAEAEYFDSSSDFIEALENIVLDPGDVCEESALSGIDAAIDKVQEFVDGGVIQASDFENGDIFVFTDASQQALDPALDVTEDKYFDVWTDLDDFDGDLRVHFILSDTCSSTGGEVDPIFRQIASDYGGFILPTTKDDITDAVLVISNLLITTQRATQTLMVVETDDEVITVPVTVEPKADDYLLEIIISGAFGAEPRIRWIREQGSTTNMAFDSTMGDGYEQARIFVSVTSTEIWEIRVDFDTTNRRRSRTRRNLLQTDSFTNKLNAFSNDLSLGVDTKVKNVNEFYSLLNTRDGYLFYQLDGNFVIYSYARDDDSASQISTISTIGIRSLDSSKIITKTAILDIDYHDVNNDQDVYYALFSFAELDVLDFESFKVEVTGYDIDNNLFSRLSPQTTKISNINIHIDCSDALFITNYESDCEAIFERRDSNSQETYSLIFLIDNSVLTINDDVTIDADNTVTFAANVASITKTFSVKITDNNNIVGNSFSIRGVVVNQDTSRIENYNVIGEFTIKADLCGKLTQCLTDPCTCDELTNCNVCNEGDSGGCSQCDHGYFKKGSQYSCANCDDVFGDKCLVCQDWHGCAQCADGSILTYEERCDVYYCKEFTPAPTTALVIDITDNHCKIEEYLCDDENGRDCFCSELSNCNICNNNSGCDQCANGFFKVNNKYNCASCSEIFGDNCLFCQDYRGCGQCRDGCQQVLDNECNVWYCDCS